jgi:hypothetical protein
VAEHLRAFLRAGGSWGDFWRLTPYATSRLIEAHAARRREELDALIAAAWHGEAFNRSKRLQPLKKYLSAEQSDAPRVQSPLEKHAAFRHLAMAGVVKVIRHPPKVYKRAEA